MIEGLTEILPDIHRRFSARRSLEEPGSHSFAEPFTQRLGDSGEVLLPQLFMHVSQDRVAPGLYEERVIRGKPVPRDTGSLQPLVEFLSTSASKFHGPHSEQPFHHLTKLADSHLG